MNRLVISLAYTNHATYQDITGFIYCYLHNSLPGQQVLPTATPLSNKRNKQISGQSFLLLYCLVIQTLILHVHNWAVDTSN